MKLKLSSGMKNVAKISTGTVIGQIVSIVSLPFVTRIYGAEIMGIWTTIYAIAIIVNTVSDLGLIQSVMVEDEEKVQKTYSVVSVFIGLISLLATLFVFLYCFLILKYDLMLTLTVVVFTFIYSVTLQFVQLMYTWLNRNKEYNVLMKNPIINQVSMAFFSVVLGLLGFKTFGYYIGVTIGQVLTLLHMKRSSLIKFQMPDKKTVKETLSKNKDFLKFQMPTNITIQIRNQLPNLLIGGLFGNTILGYFSISQKLLNIPITFIGQSLGKVFYQKCAEMQRQGLRLGVFIYRNLKRAMLIAFVPMVLLAAFGDAAIVMFFGEQYRIGGVIVRIIVFRSFFTFVSTATQGMDIVLKKQKYAMFCGIAQTVFVAIAVVASYYLTADIIICSIAITVAFIIIQIAYFCVMFKVMEVSMYLYLRSILLSLAAVIILSLALRYAFIFITDLTGWNFLKFLKGYLVL